MVAAIALWYEASTPGPPDVILLSIDTLRAEHLGCYGYGPARTPIVDALAAQGTVFRNAYTPFPRTTPAIASLFTGLWPSQHGSREVKQPMAELPTLAALLSQHGYHTVAVSGTDALSESTNVHLGFDYSFVRNVKHAKNLNRRVLPRLKKAPPGQPLFLWVHYMDPHWGYEPLPEWRSEQCTPDCYNILNSAGEFVASNLDGAARAVLGSCTACYNDEIAHVDHSIGELLQAIRGLRGHREQLIIVTSDHGENMGEGGVYYEHGPTVHEVALRVPLIIVGPGVAPRVEERVVTLVDVLPTLWGHLGLPEEDVPPTSGRDLSDWLRAPEDSAAVGRGHAVFAESGSALFVEQTRFVHSGTREGRHCLNAERYSLCGEPGGKQLLFDHIKDPRLLKDVSEAFPQERARLLGYRELWAPEEARERTVISGRFKLVERPLASGGYRSSLYDLARDRDEVDDLAVAFPDEARRLREILEAWAADTDQDREDEERSAETLERLRSLGYVR
jgi:arylsulfatase